MGANDPLLMLPYSLSSHCDWNYKEKLLNHFCLHLHTGKSLFSIAKNRIQPVLLGAFIFLLMLYLQIKFKMPYQATPQGSGDSDDEDLQSEVLFSKLISVLENQIFHIKNSFFILNFSPPTKSMSKLTLHFISIQRHIPTCYHTKNFRMNVSFSQK